MTEDRDRLQREMDEDRAAIEDARELRREIDRTLERHQQVKREVLPRLRRLGLLR